MLTVLSVAYPFAAVGPDAVGGAEQVLSAIDHALVRRGHRSIVVAQEGSSSGGTLVPVPAPAGALDDAARRRGHERHRAAIGTALRTHRVDLVHMHGVDFHAYLPGRPVPVLATLHLPPDLYPPEALRPHRPDTYLNCVSATQHEACPSVPHLLPPVGNGVPDVLFGARHARRRFALFLGRICPEKGVHIAMDAAARAGVPLLIGGEVFPYVDHRRYFEEEVAPRLGPLCRFLGPVGFARKRRLLSAASCLLLPSLAAETSSLVAREALACGTPVIAFDRGALAETVENGRTGYLVDDLEAMAAAIGQSGLIDPEACRTAAQRFSTERMIDGYIGLYRRILRDHRRYAGSVA
ncbi:glycosyltransferase [Faunimonas sp. B44]|uniref:glycosyltransferase n=1 Tax=Faunimonas sp. B44 TaxID=3461493 RepID=UPI0040442FF7